MDEPFIETLIRAKQQLIERQRSLVQELANGQFEHIWLLPQLRAGLRELDRHGIRSFFIHGNHDPIDEGWSAIRREDFPPSATLFDGSDEVRSGTVMRDGEPLATVHGISFRTAKETRNLSQEFLRSGGGFQWRQFRPV